MNAIDQQGKTQHMNALTISVVIPAYNEEKTIDEVLIRTYKTMETIGLPYEIIVVDDGSTDKTRMLAERHKVTTLTNGTNKGKGHALKTGLQHAIGNMVITMDADGSHQPEEIPHILKPLLSGADIVTGSRFLGRRENGSIRALNVFGNHLFNFLIWILTRKHITDSQTGFRGFKQHVLEEIEITSEGYDVETELTVKALRNGYMIKEEPITCQRRKEGNSHLKPLHDGIRISRNIIKAYLLVRAERAQDTKHGR
jgi:glycosyltransferase involved in cell wall biosynthesis